MKPKILVLTGRRTHHRYFINELSQCGEIVGIIIENRKNPTKKKKIKKFGILWTFSKILSKLYQKFKKKDAKVLEGLNEAAVNDKFKDFQDKIVIVNDINSPESINKIQRFSPDYICSLGGALIKGKGISLARKCALNFHSGVSPFYNGADINSKVFESRNLNFIGGTLMVMTEKIDGGMILAHYFPSIEEDDTPDSLFFKGIVGGVKLYKDFINYNEMSNTFSSIPQKTPMHYFLGYDHQVMTDIITNYFLKKGLIKKFMRQESWLKYYDKSNDVNDLFTTLKLF